MPKLSPRRLAFVREYVANGGNATRAYVAAGYSKNGAAQSAEKLLRNAEVRRQVEERQQRKAQAADVTEAEVLGYLKAHARGEKGSTRAAELLGQHIGMWSEQAQTAEDAFNDVVEAADADTPAEG